MPTELSDITIQSVLPCDYSLFKNNLRVSRLPESRFVFSPKEEINCQSLLQGPELKTALDNLNFIHKQKFEHQFRHGYWKLHPHPHHQHDSIIPASWIHDTPHMKLVFHRLQNLPDGDLLLENDPKNNVGYFISGGIAGIVSRTCTAPLDRLKVMLISDTGSKPSPKYPFATLLHTTKVLWNRNGIRSFFVGNGINVLKVMPESSIKFGTYEAMKRVLGISSSSENHSPLYSYLAGGMAGSVAQMFIYPVDTLKFRIQCSDLSRGQHGKSIILSNAKELYKSVGIRGYYRGVLVGILGMFPYSATDLGTFEGLKRTWIGILASRDNVDPQDVKLPNGLVMAFGALSGSTGATIVFPLNVIRTRLQTQGTSAHPATYDGFIDCFYKTTKNEGFRGLYKGLSPNLLKVAPSVAISYLVYENCKKWLGLE
ncbi:Carrier protein [Schizosaccharomyces pombe]|uniref:Uncharacterized mitochondrial carrier C12D12.05c n=1 Tax=Schizosaccharomyces pombe (strain 972 / ATCC 24843) TaxID=284812 RepID=YBT5_SCHPO|nr:putative calcium-binding subfamily carrier protein [Schizosaccharomyces pombe]O94502.2 RecName: Full=Uncharacterized mitochondrial carrier C12D12.05c [Schizosaccharomyces pombe 972h-]CAA22679.2 mitochondrial carrier, calcium binding subfamily (predicted) [Schizosaccharomyces pombe]|eukprot:NP_595952.1 putative calcium-binding subfamily carrier protein [Schizosaccharomyces pombe]